MPVHNLLKLSHATAPYCGHSSDTVSQQESNSSPKGLRTRLSTLSQVQQLRCCNPSVVQRASSDNNQDNTFFSIALPFIKCVVRVTSKECANPPCNSVQYCQSSVFSLDISWILFTVMATLLTFPGFCQLNIYLIFKYQLLQYVSSNILL